MRKFVKKLVNFCFEAVEFYRAGEALKRPIRYPFIPYPISNNPKLYKDFAHIDKDLFYRVMNAEAVIDDVLFLSHNKDNTDQENLEEIRISVEKYITAYFF